MFGFEGDPVADLAFRVQAVFEAAAPLKGR